MNVLESIAELENIPQVLSILMSADNALDYNKEKLIEQYCKGGSELSALALTLCGYANEELVYEFVEKGTKIKEFLKNVACNDKESIPLIIRVINLAYINQRIRHQHE